MKILVTAQAFSVSGRALQAQLEALGCSVTHSAPWGPLNEHDLIDQAAEADAIIAATDSYTPTVFKSLPNLKLIARCGVGIDSVNLPAATQAGVLVTTVPEAMTDAVADYCFGLLLSAARHIHTGYVCMKSNGWGELPGIELRDKQLGLVGLGRIGQAVAKRAFGFGLKVAAYDPALETIVSSGQAPMELIDLASHIEWLSFDSLLKSSDFVSIHAPNSPENKHLFSSKAFQKMQSHALLINTSRGGLVDTKALIDALNTKSIGGAAIDVYEEEPLPANHPLRSTPNLLLTPHNAFNSFEASRRMSQGCFDPIDALLNKIPPSVICNPQVLTQKNLRVSLNI
jgi:phosphoglycerate dehydrogenase-like enzyme